MTTTLVTGATGLTGANVCQQLIDRGDRVRALVRAPGEAAALEGIGVELVRGDLVKADDVLSAAEGSDAVIHCAAVLGGASQNLDDFRAVNVLGTTNVFDAAKRLGLRRVVALSTGTFLDLSTEVPYEQSPVLANPPDDPYTVTKLEAFREAMRRSREGEDIVVCHPGAIYGPGLVVDRALHRTSFNAILLAAMRGRIKSYLRFPVTWVAAADVARGSIAALDLGEAGARYWLAGRPEDTISTAAGCNRACEIAGVEHRVDDLDCGEVPAELAEAFGPTLMAISAAAENEVRPSRPSDTPTSKRLGYHPMSLDDGLRQLVEWLRRVGKL